MTFPRLILAFVVLLATTNASAKLVGDIEIRFSPPPGHEELCATSQEAYQLVAKGTHPDSLLITCFINQQDWARGEGALLFKVEVMRPFINKTFSNAEFADYVAGAAKVIGYVNNQTRVAAGAIGKEEKKAADELINNADSPVQYSVKKGMWQHVQTGSRFEILQMVSSVKVQSGGRLIERDVASIMAFVNVKGRLLTLKVVNSKSESNPVQSAVSSMRIWIGHLLNDNAL